MYRSRAINNSDLRQTAQVTWIMLILWRLHTVATTATAATATDCRNNNYSASLSVVKSIATTTAIETSIAVILVAAWALFGTRWDNITWYGWSSSLCARECSTKFVSPIIAMTVCCCYRCPKRTLSPLTLYEANCWLQIGKGRGLLHANSNELLPTVLASNGSVVCLLFPFHATDSTSHLTNQSSFGRLCGVSTRTQTTPARCIGHVASIISSRASCTMLPLPNKDNNNKSTQPNRDVSPYYPTNLTYDCLLNCCIIYFSMQNYLYDGDADL